MRFNDRSMALLGVPDLPTEAFKHAGDRRIKPQGGGGGQPTQTTSTAYQTNIPEYAKPYVETMLGATQKQLFQTQDAKDAQGNVIGTNITGFQPYKAYGGTYDAAGNQTSYDPSKGVAAFQPMQTAAQQGVANMQVPGQYNQAMDITGRGIRDVGGLMGLGYQAANAGNQYAAQATNPASMQAYMSPYMQNVVENQQREAQRQADIASTGRNAQAVKAGAFGGARQAITDAEAGRNLALQKGDIQSQGLQNAFQQAQQAQQYGANLGLQGLQAGMQGVGQGINAGYQGANQLANLGQQQLAAQQNIYGLQNQYGAQQQAQQQQILNQAQQDYANAQQYPLMQLGTMSNMIRGLPMQASTTQQYQAQPSALTQGIGAIGAATSAYNAFNPPAKGASGGLPREFKNSLGIMSYNVGGDIKSKLYDMDEQGLEEEIKSSDSPALKRMAQAILNEKKSGAAMAGGGIVAFARGSDGPVQAEPTASEILQQRVMQGKPTGDVMGEDKDSAPSASEVLQQRVMQGKPTGNVMGLNSVPIAEQPSPQGITQAKPPTLVETLQQSQEVPDSMKAMARDYAAEYGTSVEDRMAKKQAERQALGIGAPGVEQMSRLMAERANADDEAYRNRWLRAAEFFSKWGSTPGPVLVAGMVATKDTIPNVISDEKEAKKIRMEIDKSIAGLEEATRLEKKGDWEAATAEKQKWADKMQGLNLKMIEFEETEKRTLAQEKRAQIRADADFNKMVAHDTNMANLQNVITDKKLASDEKIAGMQAMWHKAEKEQWNDQKKMGLLQAAISHADGVENQINNIMKTTGYIDAVNNRAQFKDSPSEQGKKLYEAADQAVRNFETNFATMRNNAKTTVDAFKSQLSMPTSGGTSSNQPKGTSARSTVPPPPPGARLD